MGKSKNVLAFVCTLALCCIFAAPARGQQPLYAVDEVSNLYLVDPANGNTTLIGPMGIDWVSALAVDSVTGVLYAGTGGNSTNPGCLYTVNTATGASTLVGCSGVGTQGWPGMDFRSDGTLFAAGIAAVPGGSRIYTINTTDGSATPLGFYSPPASDQGVGIAFGPGNVLYHSGGTAAWGNNQFSILDQTTGAATLGALQSFVGFPPFPPFRNLSLNSLSFNENGQLYGFVRDVASDPREVYLATADPVNGQVTHVARVIDNMTAIAFGLAPPPVSVPTVNEWGIILFSLLLVGSALWVIRRQKSL